MSILNLFDQELHVVDQGSGPALVLFPDAPHGILAYQQEVDLLSETFRVIAFDLPGYGHSTRDVLYQDEREYDFFGFAADLACHLLLEKGIRASAALGFGTGALSALHFCGHQVRLHQMTATCLVCDSFLADWSPRDIHRAMDRREHYYVRHAKELAKQHGEDWRTVCDADTALWRRLADHGGYAMPDAMLKRVTCPTLLTGNISDLVTPDVATEFASISGLIPDCSLHIVSQSGHRYDEQHPLAWAKADAWRSVVDAFLAQNSLDSSGDQA